MRRGALLSFKRLVKDARASTEHRKFARLSDDELRDEIVQLNKAPQLKGMSSATMNAVVAEVTKRIKYVPYATLRDAIVVAHGTRNYHDALAMFHARAAVARTDVHFAMFDAVVESAYELRDAAKLLELASFGASRISTFRSDYPTDIAMARILWRIACLPQKEVSADDAKTAFTAAWRAVGQYNDSATYKAQECDRVWYALRRAVMYSLTDEGEMHAMRTLLDRGAVLCAKEQPLQLQVAQLKSCRAGLWTDQAETYYLDATHGRSHVDEILLFTYMSVLQAAKDYKRMADVGTAVFESGATPSHSVVAMIAQAAGEEQLPALVERAYELIVGGTGEQDRAPARFPVFACLGSLAKCGVADFRERLESCIAAGLAEDAPEGVCFLLLQHAMHTTDPASAYRAVEAEVEALSPMTERVYNQILQLQLRVDDPRLLATYRRAVYTSGFMRQPWLELLVTWADRRRYAITDEERDFVLAEVRKHRGTTDATSDGLGGMRPMVALLQHDQSAQPLRRFRDAKVITDPPPLVDPRVHFLLRRQQRSVAVPRWDAPPVRAYETPSRLGGMARLRVGDKDDTQLFDAFVLQALAEMQLNTASNVAAATLRREA